MQDCNIRRSNRYRLPTASSRVKLGHINQSQASWTPDPFEKAHPDLTWPNVNRRRTGTVR